MFQYDVVYTDQLSDDFRLDVWYCHVSIANRYVFNIELGATNLVCRRAMGSGTTQRLHVKRLADCIF